MNWLYEKGRIYSLGENNELLAEATYVSVDECIVNVDHTYVNPSLRGQGVAGKMMVVVSEFLRENKLKAVASCSYANVWFQKNAENYSDVISSELDNDTLACKLGGNH